VAVAAAAGAVAVTAEVVGGGAVGDASRPGEQAASKLTATTRARAMRLAAG
jgi:hypothetical protein